MKRNPNSFRKIRRIAVVTFLSLTLLLGLLLLPATQTFLAKRTASSFAQRFDTQLLLGKVFISPSGYATLKDILALDHKQDTLIYIGSLDVPALRLRAVLLGDSNLGKVSLRNVTTNIVTYKDDEKSNMDIFFDRLKSNAKVKKSKTTFNVSQVSLTKSSLLITNQNNSKEPLVFSNLNADIQNFEIIDSVIQADISHIDTQTNFRNIDITSISGHYMFSPTKMELSNANVQTPSSIVNAEIQLNYPKSGLKFFTEVVKLNVDVKNATIGDSEVSEILSDWHQGSIDFNGKFQGTLRDFTLTDARVQREKTDLKFSLIGQDVFDKSKRKISGLWNLKTTEATRFIPKGITEKDIKRISEAGLISSKGDLILKNDVWQTSTNLNTSFGKLDVKATYVSNTSSPSYTLKLISDSFDVGTFSSIQTLGTSGLDITLSGTGLVSEALEAQASGTLTNFIYRDYTYDKVFLSGKINPKQFNGTLNIYDDALDLELTGDIDFAAAIRNFSFTSTIHSADFSALGWIPESITGDFSGNVDLALQGNTIDEMIGDLYIEQGKLTTPKKTHVFSNVAAQSRLINGLRVINLSSDDVASGLVIGKFKPSDLTKLIQNALGSQYENYIPKKVDSGQYADFNFNIKGKIARALFGEDIAIDDNTFVKGKVNAEKNLLKINIRSPQIRIKNTILTNANLQIDTKNPLYHSLLTIEDLNSSQTHFTNIQWINSKVNDKLYGRVEFSGVKSSDVINEFNTSFTINEKAEFQFKIHSADFYFNNKRWNLGEKSSPLLSLKNKNKFNLSSITLFNGVSSISAEASKNGQDSFSLDLNFEQVDLGDVLSFKRNKWAGIVDGSLKIQQTPSGYNGNSNLKIDNLILNDIPLGNAYLRLKSQQRKQNYKLDFRLLENSSEVIHAKGTVGLEDFTPIWNIDATFKNYSLAVLHGLTKDVFSPFGGKASGKLKFISKENTLLQKGVLYVDDLTLGVPYLNTTYAFEKVVPFVFEPNTITVSNAGFSSGENQYGYLDGILQHSSFSDWRMKMDIKADNLNVLATEFTEEALYYGNAYLSGSARLYGPFSNLNIDVVGQTAQNTNLFIPIQYDTAIGDVSFINFISKKTTDEAIAYQTEKVEGLQLDFDLDITPDAEVEIVVDPETKSALRGRGAGNLLLEIDTAGSFAVWGDFIALEGAYNFKNLGLIDKNFRLRPGGTIVWEGDPYGAQINMQAVYEVPGGANPAIILEGDNISQKIDTEVSINLFGDLLNPETPTFEIDFPNASSVMKNELNYRLNDEERRQLQAISLLSQGAFINEVSLAAISSQTLTNNLFQKASGVFDNLFANENDQLNLSLDYLQGDRNAAASIQNRDRLGVSLSTNINERVLIDGKVGVPVGSEEETTIIGDVKLEFLLNKQGTLRARVFNRENEFQYFGDELGYTQGLGLNYQVRFDSFDDLIRKLIKKKN